jgi:antitoxin component YwqK of YwqJK toxin-antitoxin module
VPKYRYEFRKDPADGKWKRNGKSSAYYATGVLEREGMYKNNKRVGIWKYYDAEGKLIREENRGDGSAPDPH